jgi:hypothetical protein
LILLHLPLLIGATLVEMLLLYISLRVFNWGTLLVAQLVEALRYKPEGRGFDSE